jgi:hypothetical protein
MSPPPTSRSPCQLSPIDILPNVDLQLLTSITWLRPTPRRALRSDCGSRGYLERDSTTRNSSPDPLRRFGQFLLCLLYVSVRVQLTNVIERYEMKVNVWDAETLDCDAYPFSVGRFPDRLRQLLRCMKDSGIERFFQIEKVVYMSLRDQQGVAWVTGASGEEGHELLRLPDPMGRFRAPDDFTEDAFPRCHA